MVKAIISLLHILTHEPSIATAGYRYGLHLLEKYDKEFEDEEKVDAFFVTKFLYLLDTTFQRFCDHLMEGMDQENPITGMSHLEHFMTKNIRSQMSPFLDGAGVANIQLPRCLQPQFNPNEGLPPAPRGLPIPPPAQAPAPAPAPAAAPAWHRRNPRPVSDWAVPQGKTFGEFFNRNNQQNFEGFPSAPHHATGLPETICIKYQVTGLCPRGTACRRSHIHPDRISPEDKVQIKSRLESIYQS
ncbi:MAG: hypothetical protein F6J96_34775 [Symploca sp. SIO1C2]|nr:hypothetical protein [Symploca sp. SIO1C2]